MIYIDVTAACLLPLQSGIPRTTRGLYGIVAPRATPIFWQPFRACYTALSARSRRLLENAEADFGNKTPPRDSTWPLLRAGLSDLCSWPQAIPLRRLLTKHDTLFLTSIFPDNRLGYLRRLLAAPGRKVAIFHDAIPLHDPGLAAWEKARHVEALRLLAQFDLVIAVSESARIDLETWWKKFNLPTGKIAVLPWPVPFSGPRPGFTGLPDGPRILYVSRLKKIKNHATLFAACESLWREGLKFELELIGCEDEARESRVILNEIERLRRDDRLISWRAQVSEQELHRAYQQATFTVFPSLMEGFGLPVIESLWHGRPVICHHDGAVADLARGGGCIAVDASDPSNLAAAMREWLQHPDRCQSAAREAYARPFRSWEDYARDLGPLLEPAT